MPSPRRPQPSKPAMPLMSMATPNPDDFLQGVNVMQAKPSLSPRAPSPRSGMGMGMGMNMMA